MNQSYDEQMQDKINDIVQVLNYHISLCNEDPDKLIYNYETCVMLSVDAFHTAIYADEDNYFDWYIGLMSQNFPKLVLTDFIKLQKITKMDFLHMYYWLVFDTFYVGENALFTEKQRIKLNKQLNKSDLIEVSK